MMWFRVAFDEARTHCCPQVLLADLVLEMSGRGHPVQDYERDFGAERAKQLGGNPKHITEWALDLGGMWAAGQPIETFDLDGLAVSVPSDHVATIAHVVRNARQRGFGRKPYYKLHLWHHATVLTVPQYDELAGVLHARERAATQRADEWFAERKGQPVTS